MPILPVGMFDVLDRSGILDVFILPQFWGDKCYKEYYTSRDWDHVIIDNAMYEQPNGIPFGDLICIADSISARRTFIVAPEDLKHPSHTTTLALNTGDRFGFRDSSWEMMCILHGTPMEMLFQYNKLKNYPMGYGIAVSTWRNRYDRTGVYKFINFRPTDYVHAMGWDSIIEVYGLTHVGFNSIDSSIPATAAVNGMLFGIDTKIVRGTGGIEPTRVNLLQQEFTQLERIACAENIRQIREYLI